MFSGIITNTGIIKTIVENGTTKLLTISSPISDLLHIDQSIAHDGICLTIIKVEDGTHQVEVVKETQSKTTYQNLRVGQMINLEKSITLQTLLDGHLVQGHVDVALTCQKITDMKGSWLMKFNLPREFSKLVIPHGSICINGISLTVANINDDSFDVSIIPYTFEHTNIQFLKENDLVNVEFDLIGKYLLRQMELGTITE